MNSLASPIARIGRNQLVGTLLLLFIGILFSPFIAELEFLVPTSDQDLVTRIIVLLSLGFFVGYLTELFLTDFGGRITRRVIAAFSEHRKDLRGVQNDHLSDILKGVPFLEEIGKSKSSYDRFSMVAYHLSQSKFIEFPEMSPVSNLRRAESHAVSAVWFLGIFAASLILGLVTAMSPGFFYFNLSRSVTLFLVGILGLLMFLSARKEYDDHRENTILSLRQEIEKRMVEKRRVSEEELLLRRERDQEKKRRDLEQRERDLELRESIASTRKVAEELKEDTTTVRKMALDKLHSIVTSDRDFVNSSELEVIEAIESCLDFIPILVEEKALVGTLFQSFGWILHTTESEVSYNRFTGKYSPVVEELLRSRPADVELVRIILDIAGFFESPSVVDAAFDAVQKADPGQIGHFYGSFLLAIGNSHLSDLNQERIETRLKNLARDRPEGHIAKLVSEVNRTLLDRKNRKPGDRPNIPQVRRPQTPRSRATSGQ